MITYKVKVYDNGNKEWYLNNKLHREDGPALEYADGYKAWFLNGKYHREDGPAIEYADGTTKWCLNGKYHRVDGPAIEYINGNKYWFLNGEEVTEQQVMNTHSVIIDGKEVTLSNKSFNSLKKFFKG